MIFYIGHYETQSFEFYTYAETPELALELMRKQWAKHKKQTGALYQWQDVKEWVTITATEMNSAHRR